MNAKKNPKKDVNQNKGLYFVIGLTAILALTYTALEWKVYDTSTNHDTALNLQDDLVEPAPITIHIKTLPPPPPPIAPPVIEIIENEDDKKETEIAAIEPTQDMKIVDPVDLDVIDLPEEVTIPFTVIEEVPVFPGCENAGDKRACFQKMMNKHIRSVFKYPEISQEMGVQGKVYTTFIIEKDGTIGGLRLRGPDKNLEKEAKRIIEKLPKMIPGKQRGSAVKVPFSIPINFRLQ